MGKQPKQYSGKLRRRVLRKVMDERQPVSAVSLASGVPERLIDDWVDEEIGRRGEAAYEGYSREELLAERDRLLREREYLLAKRDTSRSVAADVKGGEIAMSGLDPLDEEDGW